MHRCPGGSGRLGAFALEYLISNTNHNGTIYDTVHCTCFNLQSLSSAEMSPVQVKGYGPRARTQVSVTQVEHWDIPVCTHSPFCFLFCHHVDVHFCSWRLEVHLLLCSIASSQKRTVHLFIIRLSGSKLCSARHHKVVSLAAHHIGLSELCGFKLPQKPFYFELT
jgi:hypothetical protein